MQSPEPVRVLVAFRNDKIQGGKLDGHHRVGVHQLDLAGRKNVQGPLGIQFADGFVYWIDRMDERAAYLLPVPDDALSVQIRPGLAD